MKLKLYELLAMIANNQIKGEERLIFNEKLFVYRNRFDYPFFYETIDKRSLSSYLNLKLDLNIECELIDRKREQK